MKKSSKLLPVCIGILSYCSGAYAQDTTLIKQQANIIVQAMLKGDYKTIVNNAYPSAVKMAGGKDKMQEAFNHDMDKMKAEGVSIEKVEIGTPGNFCKSGTEIYCLVPTNTVVKAPQGRALVKSSMLGISSNQGKNWAFLNVDDSTQQNIKELVPNINPNLKFPHTEIEKLP